MPPLSPKLVWGNFNTFSYTFLLKGKGSQTAINSQKKFILTRLVAHKCASAKRC